MPSEPADHYRSNGTLEQVAERLRGAQRIAATTHAKPDGDAMGSLLALARAMKAMGKHVDIFVDGPLEESLKVVCGETPYRFLDQQMPGDDYDCIVVVDTGARSQLERLEPWLRRHRDRVIVLDHHAHGDDLAALRIVDTTRAATVQILLRLLRHLGCEITGGRGGVAEPLFVGLATDTGWFRYANAQADAFRDAADLLARGVDKTGLYQLIEETARPARLALEARALASLEFAAGGAAAVMSLSRADFKAAGGSLEDLTGMVNMPLIVGAVRVSVLLVEKEAAVTKVSFRSKAAPADDPDAVAIDVNELAGRFGGGGHVHAAGAHVPLPLAEARARIIAALGEVGGPD